MDSTLTVRSTCKAKHRCLPSAKLYFGTKETKEDKAKLFTPKVITIKGGRVKKAA
jgi:hypothetical protein